MPSILLISKSEFGVGILLDKGDGKKSVKIDLIPAGNWDGWLTASERKEKGAEKQA